LNVPWQANITKRATFTVFLTPDGMIRIAYEKADLLPGKPCYMGIQGGEGEAIRFPAGDYADKEVMFVPGVADEDPEPLPEPVPDPEPDPCPECPPCPECEPCPACPKCGQPFDRCSKCDPCPPCPEPEPCPPCEPIIKEVVKEVPVEVIKEVPVEVERIVIKEVPKEVIREITVDRLVWAPWYWIKKAWEKVF